LGGEGVKRPPSRRDAEETAEKKNSLVLQNEAIVIIFSF